MKYVRFTRFGGEPLEDRIALTSDLDITPSTLQAPAARGDLVSGVHTIEFESNATAEIRWQGVDSWERQLTYKAVNDVATLRNTLAGFTIDSTQFGTGLGISVSGVGDFNSDGWDDIAIGVEGYTDGDGVTIGAIKLIFGGAHLHDTSFENATGILIELHFRASCSESNDMFY